MVARLLCAFILIAPFTRAQSSPAEQPTSKQLKLVVILTRHGVRSPTSMMPGYSSHSWPDLAKDWHVACCGDLTPRGAELVFLMGAYYRSYYAGRNLLPALGCVAQQTYIWADNEERPIATANALAQGLSGGLPGCSVAVNSLPFQLQPCSSSGSNICQRPSASQTDLWFHPLPALWSKVSQQENNDLQNAANDVNQRFPQLVSKYRPSLLALQNVLDCCNVSLCQTGAPPCTLLTMTGKAAPGQGKGGGALNWSGPFSIGSTASEIFLLEYANGMPCRIVGWEKVQFNAPDCRGPESFRLMQEIHTLYFGEVQQKAIVGKIQGSNLGNQILLALQKQVQSSGASPTKLVIFSGHDSNIANIAGLLGLKWKLPDLPDNDTPPAGALVFELSSDASNNYYVRVRYVHQTLTQLRTGVILSPANPPNWVDVEMPNCTPECTFSTFQQIVQAAIDPNLTTKTASGN